MERASRRVALLRVSSDARPKRWRARALERLCRVVATAWRAVKFPKETASREGGRRRWGKDPEAGPGSMTREPGSEPGWWVGAQTLKEGWCELSVSCNLERVPVGSRERWKARVKDAKRKRTRRKALERRGRSRRLGWPRNGQVRSARLLDSSPSLGLSFTRVSTPAHPFSQHLSPS